MTANSAAAPTENPPKSLLPTLRGWLEPRATDRDEAFRERSIRIAIALVIILGLISFGLSTFVYKNEWGLISLPSLHVIVLLGFFGAAVTVSRQQVNHAANFVVITGLIAAAGFSLLSTQSGSVDAFLISIPLFMVVILIAALVAVRKAILPISVLTTLIYLLVAYNASPLLSGISSAILSSMLTTAIVLLPAEGVILHRLRVEFDARLDAMHRSMRQAEIAQKQAEEAREQAEIQRQRAEASDRAKSQFLANMSHELRTPLNAIIGYDEAMLGGMAGTFTPQQTKLLTNIQYNSRRLLGLINDILDLAKIESGSLQVFLSPMSPTNVIRETVEGIRSLADNKQIGLEVEFAPEVPEIVLSDANKLQQVLVNLVSNAVKFTNQGGVTVRVGVVDNANWKVEVDDTGIGIPAASLKSIFEPFQQVDSTDQRKYKGTGLGLAITQRLVERLGGSIDVKSAPGEGSTFTVVLPRAYIPGDNEDTAKVANGEMA